MSGKILITRPIDDALDYAKELEGVGFSCLVAPMLVVQRGDYTAPDLSLYDGILFTSAQAVNAFDVDSGFGIPVYCVGKHTARAARDMGFLHVQSADGTGKDLVALVAGVDGSAAKRFLHVHGAHLAFPVVEMLLGQGIKADGVCVYKTVKARVFSEETLAAISGNSIDCVTFFSRRTAQAFLELVAFYGVEDSLRGIKLLSISASVVECVRSFEWANNCARLYVSKTPDRAGMLNLLQDISEMDNYE